MAICQAIKKILLHQDLTGSEMTACLQDIMQGIATPSQIAGFLIALEMKGPTVEELTATTRLLRAGPKKLTFNIPLIDIVGTGGDGTKTFNISTCCAFVVAAAGGYVAKYGNRSFSSSSGSADLLEYAGIDLFQPEEQIIKTIETTGIGFLFAPYFHPALKNAANPRKDLGVRTFFNLVGPLTNPANAAYLLIGLYDKKWLIKVAEVLKNLACQHALIVHSQDGLDEISISAPTDVVELRADTIITYEITPEQFGFRRQTMEGLQVNNVKESYDLIQQVLNNVTGPALDIVLFNSGAAIYVGGLTKSIEQGIDLARHVIASGKALKKFNHFVK